MTSAFVFHWPSHWEDAWSPLLLQGFGTTLVMSVLILLLSIPMGTVLGLLRSEKIPVLSWLAAAYIEVLRSIPLILFLVLIHYGVMPKLTPEPNFFISALLAFALFETAYFAEIVRGGLRGIRGTEMDAAVSLGLTYTQRLLLIRLPLALSRSVPALLGQVISLIKDTSLASIVGVIELTRAGEIIYERTYHDFELLVVIGVIYFSLCACLSKLAESLESREHQNSSEGQKLKPIFET
ncbi:MAG: amino acid ABC transporter permease [Cyanobacteria bacterium]|nr:amino acid ABC transporter permease [Cyanobacteriota bacterium]